MLTSQALEARCLFEVSVARSRPRHGIRPLLCAPSEACGSRYLIWRRSIRIGRDVAVGRVGVHIRRLSLERRIGRRHGAWWPAIGHTVSRYCSMRLAVHRKWDGRMVEDGGIAFLAFLGFAWRRCKYLASRLARSRYCRCTRQAAERRQKQAAQGAGACLDYTVT